MELPGIGVETELKMSKLKSSTIFLSAEEQGQKLFRENFDLHSRTASRTTGIILLQAGKIRLHLFLSVLLILKAFVLAALHLKTSS